MTHDLEFDDFIVYFENPWNKQIKITKITDYEDNVIEKSDRELDRIFKQILNHCEYTIGLVSVKSLPMWTNGLTKTSTSTKQGELFKIKVR